MELEWFCHLMIFFWGEGINFFSSPDFFFWKTIFRPVTNPWFLVCGLANLRFGCGAWDAVGRNPNLSPFFAPKPDPASLKFHTQVQVQVQVSKFSTLQCSFFLGFYGNDRLPIGNQTNFGWYHRSMASATGHSKPKVLEPKALDGRNHSPKSCHPTV